MEQKITKLKGVVSEITDIKSYVNEDCVNCGRHRVELFTVSTGNQYHICEKCGYIKEMQRYVFNSMLHCDECYNRKYFLREVIEVPVTETDRLNALLFASSKPVEINEEDCEGLLRRVKRGENNEV